MTSGETRLTIFNPEVMAVTATHRSVDEPHIEWQVDFAPEPTIDDEGVSQRVVFGTLHGATNHGIAEVTVASTMLYQCEPEPSNAEFEELLVGSEELETLYDIARIAFRTVASMAGVQVELTRSAPIPVVSTLRPLSESTSPEEPEPRIESGSDAGGA